MGRNEDDGKEKNVRKHRPSNHAHRQCLPMAARVEIRLGVKCESKVKAIFDTGAPISLVKESFAKQFLDWENLETRDQERDRFTWGQGERIAIAGSLMVTVKWTKKTVAVHRIFVVNDDQLPKDVAALLGGDVIWNTECIIRNRGLCLGKTLTFGSDPESVKVRTCRIPRHWGVQLATIEEHQGWTVEAWQNFAIPPRSKMNLVGIVKMGSYRLREDVEILFDPDVRDDGISLWRAHMKIGRDLETPWILVNAVNKGNSTIFIRKGERLGIALEEFELIPLSEGEGCMAERDIERADSVRKETRLQEKELRCEQQGEGCDTVEFSEAFLMNDRDELAELGEEEALWNIEGTAMASSLPIMIGGGETEEEKEHMYVNKTQRELEKAREDFRSLLDGLWNRLPEEQAKAAVEVLSKNMDVFCDVNRARADDPKYPFYLRIPVMKNAPVNIPPYRYPPEKLMALQEWAIQQLEKGHIENTTSAWNAPMVLTRKKDGRWRFAIDLRGLNAISTFDPYMLPQTTDLMELTEGAKWFSAMDLTDGFWNCLVHPEDREKLAFTVPGLGRYQWRSMPFGLHAASSHFQRSVEAMMTGLSWEEVAIYIDDILIFTKDFDRHVEVVDAVLGRLRQGGFVAAPAKCKMFCEEVPYLGHKLSAAGLAMDPKHVEDIKSKLTEFHSKEEIRTFVGAIQYYSRFIWGCAEILAPLANALKKNVKDDLSNLDDAEKENLQKAAQKAMEELQQGPVLVLPNFQKEFVLMTDASDVAMGAALCQESDNGEMQPVCLWSRKFSETETKYSTTEREALAVIYFIEKFRYYLLGRKFLLKTDHRALPFIFNGAASNTKLARWALRIQEFSFDTVYVKGVENQQADAMSRILSERSPVEEWNLHAKKQYFRVRWRDTDVELVIPEKKATVAGNYAGTYSGLFMGEDKGKEECDEQESIVKGKVEWNEQERIVPNGQWRGRIDVVGLQREDEEAKWIRQALHNGIESVEGVVSNFWKQRVKVAIQEGRIRDEDGILAYWDDEMNSQGEVVATKRRIFAPVLLRRGILFDKHDAPWAAHLGLQKTAQRVKDKFWWPELKSDVVSWVGGCEDCQRADKGNRKKFGMLHPLPPVMLPFQRMGMDLVKMVKKGVETTDGSRYALVITDYATRFAIIIALKDKTAKTIAEAIWTRLFAFTGFPEEILSDNGGEFRNVVKEMTTMHGIHRSWTTPFHPRTNGLTERFNRTLVNMVTTVTEGGNDVANWSMYLPMIQLAYNTSLHSSIGQTPYFMMFGRRPYTPLDSMMMQPAQIEGGEWKRMLDKAREKAMLALDKVQEEQEERYNKRRKETEFQIGDLVWLQHGHVERGGNPKTAAPLGGMFKIVGLHPHGVVDIIHRSNPAGIKRVNVERLVRVTGEPQKLLTKEERIALGMEIEGMEEEKVESKESEDKRYEVRQIWGHRTENGQLEFLVEWEVTGHARQATWEVESHLNAAEKLERYWDLFRNRKLPSPPQPSSKERCKHNGFDRGCEHLRCKYNSWTEALERAGYWADIMVKSRRDSAMKSIGNNNPYAKQYISTRRR